MTRKNKTELKVAQFWQRSRDHACLSPCDVKGEIHGKPATQSKSFLSWAVWENILGLSGSVQKSPLVLLNALALVRLGLHKRNKHARGH